MGAFIEGFDVSMQLAPHTVAALTQCLGDIGVLFFRDQNLTPEQHLAFAQQFAQVVVGQSKLRRNLTALRSVHRRERKPMVLHAGGVHGGARSLLRTPPLGFS